jgi:glucuronate isomerase
MKEFINKDFMLTTGAARELYHGHAEGMPIIDYHCHLDPKMVAEDHKFRNLTELWLGGDHYKWRSMRTNGVDEKYITGDASDLEKFLKWAETVPYTMRNPHYHWTHMELRTAFGISKLLNPETAHEIYEECNEKLQQPEFSARGQGQVDRRDDDEDCKGLHGTDGHQKRPVSSCAPLRPLELRSLATNGTQERQS